MHVRAHFFLALSGLLCSLDVRAATTVQALQAIDGDTIRLSDGRTVRYMGINAPEKGQPWFDKATRANNDLIAGKKLRLETSGGSRQDRDGRLLAFVFVGKKCVNLELLRQGMAHVYPPISKKHKKSFLETQDEARAAKRGIWSKVGDAKLAISVVQSKPPRGDKNALNEYIEIENCGETEMNLNGWTVEDGSTHRYQFPKFVLRPLAKVRLHTGLGINSETDLYWGQKTPVWNDNGDILFIRDGQQNLILIHVY
ncbi:MAG: lamin tail domain-containing protein [Verrucomicrobiota bacterium]